MATARASTRRSGRPAGRKGAGRPVGAVSEETRTRILDAACRCFAARGYTSTSNQDIARAAGLTTGALYHYFGSKAAIFAAVHRHVHAVLLSVYERAFAQRATCVDQLCAGLEASLADNRAHPELAHFAATASLEIERHPELRALLAPDAQRIRRFFEALLGAGRRRGEIAADVDLDAAVNLIIAALFGLAWLRSRLAQPAEHDSAIRAFQRLLQGRMFLRPAPSAGERPASRGNSRLR